MSSLRSRRLIVSVGAATAAVALGVWLWNNRAVVETIPASSASKSAEDNKLLSLSDRQRLWRIEHIAFLLEADVFPKWKQAFQENSAQVIASHFADSFVADVPTSEPSVLFDDGLAILSTVVIDSEASKQCELDEFLDSLLSYRRQLGAGECTVSIGLVKFGPQDQSDLDGDWNSHWKIRLASQSELELAEVILQVEFDLAPMDANVGESEKWIRSATLHRVELRRSSQPLMTDITATTGMDISGLHDNWTADGANTFRTKTGGVYVCDYNQDGHHDVLIDDLRAGIRLYQGHGDGQFVDATRAAGVPDLQTEWTLSIWADFDNDGDPDLICQDRLLENIGDGQFSDVTENSNLLLTPAASYAVADFDNDGLVDLYVCHSNSYLVGQEIKSQTSWIDGSLGIDNILWRNKGDWQFEDVTEATNSGGGGTACFAAVWFDANNDRWPDLMAINEFGRNTLLINHEGQFTERTVDPIFGGFSMGVTAGDFNNDGATDLYVANMYSKAGFRIVSNVSPDQYPQDLYRKVREATTGNKLYLSNGDQSFAVVDAADCVADVGWAYGPNFVDLNGDGWLDVYATAGFRSIERGKPDG